MKRALIVAALGVLSVASAGVAIHASRGAVAEAQAPAPRGLSAPRFSWPAGTEYVYTVSWKLDSHARVAHADAIEGSLDLEADLVLRSHGAQGSGVTRLSAKLVNVRRHAMKLLGGDLVPDEATAAQTFGGAEALCDVDARGVVRGVQYRREASPLFKRVMHALLTETQVTLPDDPSSATWTASEAGVNARAEHAYSVDPKDPSTIHRSVSKLVEMTSFDAKLRGAARTELFADATIVLDPSGHVLSLTKDETAVVGSMDEASNMLAITSFSMTRTHKGTFRVEDEPLPRAEELETRLPGDPIMQSSAGDEHERDVRLARGLTITEVAMTIREYAAGRKLEGAWILHASALLRAHPEHLAAVRDLFPKLAPEGRVLVMDLLSSSGSAAAQETMRVLLDSQDAQADRAAYVRMIQRFTFVERPDRASLAYVATAYQRSKKGAEEYVRHATAYALGGVIGHMARSGSDPGLVDAPFALLVADLHAAERPEDRRALLAGLGNAGLPQGVDVIAAYAKDEGRAIRGQVATSLRKLDSDAARDTLFALLADNEAQVAMYALASLDRFALEAADLERIADLVATTHAQLDKSFVAFATRRTPVNPDAAARMLHTILDRAKDDPELADRARTALATAAGG